MLSAPITEGAAIAMATPRVPPPTAAQRATFKIWVSVAAGLT